MKQFNITVQREAFDVRNLESVLRKLANSYSSMTIYPHKSPTEDLLQLRLKNGLDMKSATFFLEELRKCTGVKKASTGEVCPS